MNHSFEPWTTAMDSGSGAQLSTFWKKRMTMLPIVRHSSAEMTHRGRLILIATATFALMLPTLYVTRSIAAVETEPEKPAAVGKAFRVMLPAGLVAEVIGVGHYPSKGQPWWAPDGTPMAAPYERIDAPAPGRHDEVCREVALRWIHEPPDSTVRLTPNTNYWYGGVRAFDANGTELPGIKVMTGMFLKTQKACNLTFTISAGPWETLKEDSGRGYVTYGEKNHGYAFSQAVEIDGATQITISHDVVDRDVRVVAVDREGREITTKNRGGGDVKKFSQLTVIFYKLPLKDIKAFRLQARNWQKAEVTGIALNPGEMTQPSVKVENPQGVPKS
jgi:hypothetical protein